VIAVKRLVAVLAVLFVGACGAPLQRYQQAVSTAATVTAVGYHLLDAYDATKMGGITEKAKAGHPAESQAELDAYLPQYKVGRKALDVAAIAVEAAPAAKAAIQAAKDKNTETAKWISILVKAVFDVQAALAPFNIKLPGVL
jgi:hypothetical protein